MHLRTRILSITIFALISLTCFSQKSKSALELKLADSSLVRRNTKLIILKQGENFEAITDRKSFIKICKDYEGFYHAELCKEFLEFLKNHDSPIVDFDEFKFHENLESVYADIFQSVILQKKCLVLNKKLNKLEKKVFADFYDFNNNNHGLEYKTENGIIVLKTIEFSCY